MPQTCGNLDARKHARRHTFQKLPTTWTTWPVTSCAHLRTHLTSAHVTGLLLTQKSRTISSSWTTSTHALQQSRRKRDDKASGTAYVPPWAIPKSTWQTVFYFRAIISAAEGRQLEGAEAEVTAEGRNQFAGTRGQVVIPNFVLEAQKRNVYGNDSGQSGIDNNVSGRQTLSGAYETALHIQPLAEQLGARVIDALGSSTMLVPFLGRTAAGSADEGASVTSNATFSELSLTPSRYARVATYSALALRTTGQALDSILTADFQQAHTSAHDKVAFDAIRANSTYTLATENGTNGLEATSLTNVFSLTKDAMSATGSNDAPALVCSPEGFKVLNTTAVSGLRQSPPSYTTWVLDKACARQPILQTATLTLTTLLTALTAALLLALA